MGGVRGPAGRSANGFEVPAADLSTTGLGFSGAAREWSHGGGVETRVQREEGICGDRTVRQASALDAHAHCGGSGTLGQLPGRRSRVVMKATIIVEGVFRP